MMDKGQLRNDWDGAREAHSQYPLHTIVCHSVRGFWEARMPKEASFERRDGEGVLRETVVLSRGTLVS